MRPEETEESTSTEVTKDSGYHPNGSSQGSSKGRGVASSGSGGQNNGSGGSGPSSSQLEEAEEEEEEEEERRRERRREEGALTSAAFSQTLATLTRLQQAPSSPPATDKEEDDEDRDEGEVDKRDHHSQLAKILATSGPSKQKEEVGIVVSMDDGVVLYTTPSISGLLGYPRDMWIGRSLIDFLHPRHRASFAGHITSLVASYNDPGGGGGGYSCYIRQYRGLRSAGFAISSSWIGYLPLHLEMGFKESDQESPKFLLLMNASLLKSAYTKSNETRLMKKFTTRHSYSCQVCHVDPEVTPYFGYLPQDILGRSILDFYHPEDLHFIRDVYQAVMKEQGHLFRSKPYRFRCQNGGFALIESELSSFINPWSRKLEFIISQHTVLRGPPNPDVTTPLLQPQDFHIPEEILKEKKILHEEIRCLLKERVTTRLESAKEEVTRRCKDLATFMENLMDEISRPPLLKVELPTEDQTISERDSVMLGEISPHHDYYDSKSSTETPPSYNQLNYNENMLRFFESKPKTWLLGDTREVEAVDDISLMNESTRDSESIRSCGPEGSIGTESRCGKRQGGAGKRPPALTEQILTRHNEDMEKQMVQRHKEQRAKPDTKVKDRLKTSEKHQEDQRMATTGGGGGGGLKRSGSHSWESEPNKSIKPYHGAPSPTTAAHLHKREYSSGGFPGSPPPLAGATLALPSALRSPSAAIFAGTTLALPGTSTILAGTSGTLPSSTAIMAGASGTLPGTSAILSGVTGTLSSSSKIIASTTGTLLDPSSILARTTSSLPSPPAALAGTTGSIPSPTTILSGTTVTLPSPSTILPGSTVTLPSPSTILSGTNVTLPSPPAVLAGSTGTLPSPPALLATSSAVFTNPPGVLASQPTVLPTHPDALASPSATFPSHVMPLYYIANRRTEFTPLFPPQVPLVSGMVYQPLMMNQAVTLGAAIAPTLTQPHLPPPPPPPPLPPPSSHQNHLRQALADSKPSTGNPNHDHKTESNETSIPYDDSSSSFFKTDKSDESIPSSSGDDAKNEDRDWRRGKKVDRKMKPFKKVAPWIEDIKVTSELVLKYQLRERSLKDVLSEDLNALSSINQPELVSEQLSQMYLDLEGEGCGPYQLEGSLISSSDSSKVSGRRKYMEYDKMVILYEEDAPLPPPILQRCT